MAAAASEVAALTAHLRTLAMEEAEAPLATPATLPPKDTRRRFNELVQQAKAAEASALELTAAAAGGKENAAMLGNEGPAAGAAPVTCGPEAAAKLLGTAAALYAEANALVPKEKIARKLAKLQARVAALTAAPPHEPQELQQEPQQEPQGGADEREGDDPEEGGSQQGEAEELEAGFQPGPTGTSCSLGEGLFQLPLATYRKLYRHQREGVQWMYGLHCDPNGGGILGDDMGLGKTIQVAAFLEGLLGSKLATHALIVAPVSLLANWEKELAKWAPSARVRRFHGTSVGEREHNLARVQRKGGVVLTTYGLVPNSIAKLNTDDSDFSWDWVILDEGHKIKNPSRNVSQAMRKVRAEHKLILTGTPIQNALSEMWALFDYVCDGSLLGSIRSFKKEFENPINQGNMRRASARERALAAELADSLRMRIAPYFLRREKATTITMLDHSAAAANTPSPSTGASAATSPSSVSASSGSATPLSPATQQQPVMRQKNDFICWVYLSELQQSIYERFLNSDEVKRLLNTTRSPLAALNVLKKVCDHPQLLLSSVAYRTALGLAGGQPSTAASGSPEEYDLSLPESTLCALDNEDLDGNALCDDSASPASASMEGLLNLSPTVDPALLVEQSGKLRFLTSLLANLRGEGHRCLIFSQSTKMLDCIQHVMRADGYSMLRVDGSVAKVADRQQRVDAFNADRSVFAFLLTTQVGGLGLTLTGADRVIIFDPSWNPSTDAQAVDRAYRIGQKEHVIVYRLITCGTIEEKIYRKQVFKDAIMRTATKAANQYRYFTKQELRDLFVLDNPRISKTQQQLDDLHRAQRSLSDSVQAHVDFLETLPVFGLSDHDLLYSKRAVHIDDDDDDGSAGGQHPSAHASAAMEKISSESSRAQPPQKSKKSKSKSGARKGEWHAQTAESGSRKKHGKRLALAQDWASSSGGEGEDGSENEGDAWADTSRSLPDHRLRDDFGESVFSPLRAGGGAAHSDSDDAGNAYQEDSFLVEDASDLEGAAGFCDESESAEDSFGDSENERGPGRLAAGPETPAATRSRTKRMQKQLAQKPKDKPKVGAAVVVIDLTSDDEDNDNGDVSVDHGFSSPSDATSLAARDMDKDTTPGSAEQDDGDEEGMSLPNLFTPPPAVADHAHHANQSPAPSPAQDPDESEQEADADLSSGSVYFDAPAVLSSSTAAAPATAPTHSRPQSAASPAPTSPATATGGRSSVCAAHTSTVVQVKRCLCMLSDEERSQYEDEACAAHMAEAAGDDEAALEHALAALELASSDLELHHQAASLAHRLGLWD